jgi:hypothetical protein
MSTFLLIDTFHQIKEDIMIKMIIPIQIQNSNQEIAQKTIILLKIASHPKFIARKRNTGTK